MYNINNIASRVCPGHCKIYMIHQQFMKLNGGGIEASPISVRHCLQHPVVLARYSFLSEKDKEEKGEESDDV